MEKLAEINLSPLRNSEHFQFMTDVDELVTTYKPEELSIDNQYLTFKTTLYAEDAALRVELGSIKSKIVEQLDKLRDKTWNAISLRVKSAILSPFENEAESTEVVKHIFDLYGDLRSKSYNEESAGLNNLVTDLMLPGNAEHLNRVAIQRWVSELNSQNKQFQAVFNERNVEFAGRESGDVRAIRLQIDPIYAKMVEKINATIVMETAKPVAIDFIKELNNKIKYYKTTLAIRNSRGKEAEAPVEKVQIIDNKRAT